MGPTSKEKEKKIKVKHLKKQNEMRNHGQKAFERILFFLFIFFLF